MTLAQELVRIDEALARKRPKVHATLVPGVGARSLARLGRQIFESAAAIPPDIATWFGWHDGQRSPEAIDGAFYLCSIDRVLELQPTLAKPRWLPLLDNGRGDHIIFERTTGAILELRHHDNTTVRRAPSLTHYARSVADALAEETAVAELAIVLARRTWRPLDRIPTERALATAAIGTAVHFDVPRGVRLIVKTSRDRWLPATAPRLEAAIARWGELAAAGPPPRHAWRSAADVRSELQEHRENARLSLP
jgi:cell wall assembly regulator SMI1